MNLRIFRQSGVQRLVGASSKPLQAGVSRLSGNVLEEAGKNCGGPNGSPSAWIWQYDCPPSVDKWEDAVLAASNGMDEWSHSTLSDEKLQETLSAPPRMIVLQAPQLTTVDDCLSYLRRVLPIGSKCLERFPTIGGSAYGRTNAHGNLLNTHVAGICHNFPHLNVTELAMLVDVYLPTRFALSPSNILRSGDQGDSIDEDDMEAVLQNTDLIYHDYSTVAGAVDPLRVQHLVDQVYTSVWEAQELENCNETYVVCNGDEDITRLEALFGERNETSQCVSNL